MKPGFYWIEILDQGPSVGLEIARLTDSGDLFVTTRFDGCGESVTASTDPKYVRIIGGPLQEPRDQFSAGPPVEASQAPQE